MTCRLRGFTLVEMLVVITVIGMLVALLIPAALGVQNAARRGVCMNNMREITIACLQYENKNGRFPPQFYLETWAREAASNQQIGQQVGWVVTILEELGKGELGGLFRDKKLITPPQSFLSNGVGEGFISAEVVVRTARITMGKSYISQLVCPANPPTSLTKASLSYVCNAGIRDWTDFGFSRNDKPDDFKENGVFMNYHANFSPPGQVTASINEKVTNSFINEHDGTSQTMLLSENVNAEVWAQDVDFGVNGWSVIPLCPTAFQQGMLWSHAALNIPGLGNMRVADPNEEIYSVPPAQVGINHSDLLYSRPSSLHGGGYHASFCSGNVMWLTTNMDKSIYPLLLSPWGERTRNTFGVVIPQNRGDGMPAIINEFELAR